MNAYSNGDHGETSSANHNQNGSARDASAQLGRGWNAGGKGSRGGGADDGKGGSGILRVSQACTNCRRMKMRCVNADSPPCKRCAHFGEECVVGQSTKRRLTAKTRYDSQAKSDRGNSSTGFEEQSQSDGRIGPQDRIGKLESQVGSMQSTLKDILAAIQSGAAGPVQTIAEPDLPWLPLRDAVAARVYDNGCLPPIQTSLSNSVQQQPVASSEIARSIESLMSQQLLVNTSLSHIPRGQDEDGIGFDTSSDWLGRPSVSHSLRNGVETPETSNLISMLHGDIPAPSPRARMSSQSPSEGEAEDPLAPDHIAAPLSTMADLAGITVGRADLREMEASTARDPAIAEAALREDGSNKKRKLSDTRTDSRFSVQLPQSLHSPGRVLSPNRIAFTSPGFYSKEVDVLDAGLVIESEAQQLFCVFFQGCNTFIPIFDTRSDTWDSLRDRSPLLFTTIIGIGARVRDGGGPVSETQHRALTHARQLASKTLFDLSSTAETVQAMILLATYDDNGRIPASHANAVAMAIGLDKCLIQLMRKGMGAGLTQDQLESDRPLVMGSRIILYLFQLEHQLAFGTGRPALFRNDIGIERCREFLLHPLSVPSDVRLISTVEMMSLRAPLHVLMTNSPDQPLNEETIAKLREANASFERWLMHWDSVFADTFAREQGDFYRESLVAQREYASLFTNSQLLRGIRNADDVKRMPGDKRELALRAINNATNCLRIALRGQSYGRAFKFAVHYTHVCVAFAATFLIRIARLFPRELDLRQSAKDVEELADLLAQVPAGRYARSLRLILRRARKHHVMPLPSRASSPSLRAVSFPSYRHEIFATIPTVEPDRLPDSSGQAAIPPADSIFDTSFDPESYQYDFDFAQELWERAGLTGGDDSLPLFLDGESLGDTFSTSFALEDFFVPPELDMRFNSLGAFPHS